MTKQVVFTADDTLKKAALAKAKQEGITLKALLIFCMKGYVQGKINLGIINTEEVEIEEIEVNSTIQNKMDKIANLI